MCSRSGPGPGFTTDILRYKTKSLTAVEIDPALFKSLSERLAGSNVQVL
jgi:16S rRNA A1518/A1519 N6-dimethyltransferase RsmA/KsgA/DIM1 with predicted DNA glycosylase/AP lyase activity